MRRRALDRQPRPPASNGHYAVGRVSGPTIRNSGKERAEPAQYVIVKALENNPFREGLEREEIGLHHIRILQVRNDTMRRQTERR